MTDSIQSARWQQGVQQMSQNKQIVCTADYLREFGRPVSATKLWRHLNQIQGDNVCALPAGVLFEKVTYKNSLLIRTLPRTVARPRLRDRADIGRLAALFSTGGCAFAMRFALRSHVPLDATA